MSLIKRWSRWRKPHICGANKLPERTYNNLFMLPKILTVGKHEYVVRYYNKELQEYEWSLHKTIVDIRFESIPPCKFLRSNYISFKRKYC